MRIDFSKVTHSFGTNSITSCGLKTSEVRMQGGSLSGDDHRVDCTFCIEAKKRVLRYKYDRYG